MFCTVVGQCCSVNEIYFMYYLLCSPQSSSICRAAIHYGILDNKGGLVDITRKGRTPAFVKSTRNGVESFRYDLQEWVFCICFQHKQMFSCLCYSYIITVIQVNLFCVFLNTFFSRLFCRKNKPSNAFMVSKVTSKYGVCQVEKKSLLLEFYEMLEDIIALFFILSDRVKWPHITTHLKMWWSITHYGQLHMYLIFLWGSKRKKGAENGDDWPFPTASPCDASWSDLSTSCNVMSCWS